MKLFIKNTFWKNSPAAATATATDNVSDMLFFISDYRIQLKNTR